MFVRFGLFAIVVALLGGHISAQGAPPQSSSPSATPTSENSNPTTAAPSAQAPGQNMGVYRVGGGVTAPEVIYAPDPEYSDEARKACYQGTVVLWLVIDAEGKPQHIRVARSLGMGLDEQAARSVRQWRFKPATKGGQPVAVQINVEVNYRLYGNLSPHPESATQPPRFPGVDTATYPLIVQVNSVSYSRSGAECTATYKTVITQPDRQQDLTTLCIVTPKQDLDLKQGTYPARWKSNQKTLEILGLNGKEPGVWTPLDCSLSGQ